MSIVIRPSGEAQTAAASGRIIGQSKNREIARAEEQRAQEMTFQKQAQDAAREWELQKMLLNSQQDFAHEQRLRQAELNKEARAQEWEVEKMELASRFDFEQEEKERLRRKTMLNAGMENIENRTDLPDEQKAKAKFELKSKNMDVEGYEYVLGLEPQTQWDLLTPEEKERAAKIKAGLEPRVTAPISEFGKPPWWASPEWKDTPEGKIAKEHYEKETLVQQVAETIASIQLNAMGVIPQPNTTPAAEPTPEEAAPIYQQNQKTGQKRVSYDGGKTWKTL